MKREVLISIWPSLICTGIELNGYKLPSKIVRLAKHLFNVFRETYSGHVCFLKVSNTCSSYFHSPHLRQSIFFNIFYPEKKSTKIFLKVKEEMRRGCRSYVCGILRLSHEFFGHLSTGIQIQWTVTLPT